MTGRIDVTTGQRSLLLLHCYDHVIHLPLQQSDSAAVNLSITRRARRRKAAQVVQALSQLVGALVSIVYGCWLRRGVN